MASYFQFLLSLLPLLLNISHSSTPQKTETLTPTNTNSNGARILTHLEEVKASTAEWQVTVQHQYTWQYNSCGFDPDIYSSIAITINSNSVVTGPSTFDWLLYGLPNDKYLNKICVQIPNDKYFNINNSLIADIFNRENIEIFDENNNINKYKAASIATDTFNGIVHEILLSNDIYHINIFLSLHSRTITNKHIIYNIIIITDGLNAATSNPTPFIRNPAPFTRNPAPFTRNLTPSTSTSIQEPDGLNAATSNPTPFIRNPAPFTRNLTPSTSTSIQEPDSHSEININEPKTHSHSVHSTPISRKQCTSHSECNSHSNTIDVVCEIF